MPAAEPCAGASEPHGQGAGVLPNCRVWLAWAASQIEGSLANDSAECDRLIAGLADMLRSAGRRPKPGNEAESVETETITGEAESVEAETFTVETETITGEAESVEAESVETGSVDSDSVEEKMSRVVIAVQSHDRLMQQLSHVAQALRALHEHLGAERSGSADGWRDLEDRQLRAFSMPEERALFVGLVGCGSGIPHPSGTAPPGEHLIELFGELATVEATSP